MKTRLHALLLSTFRRTPAPLRRLAIRAIAPSFTVGSVAVIRDEIGNLLLLRERHHSGWSLPGGLLGRHETPELALVRELREEIGVTVDAARVGVPSAVVDEQVRRVDLVFVLTLPAGSAVIACEPEVIEASWFALADLPDLFAPTAAVLDSIGIERVDAAR
jgi:8-oxo-dGTP pyrophosphatase MutT (NUDIX family)